VELPWTREADGPVDDEGVRRLRPQRTALGIRAFFLGLAVVLAASVPGRLEALRWSLLLVVAAVVASIPTRPLTARLLRIAEAVAAAVAVIASADPSSPLFPYLLAPTFVGGLLVGATDAMLAIGFAALALLVGVQHVPDARAFGTAAAEWTVIGVGLGLLGAWIRTVQPAARRVVAAPADTSYAAAYRLLAQLRPVARQLSVGLDPGTIADGLLQTLREHLPFERGAVFVRTGAGRLVPLVHLGASRVDWDVDVAGDSPYADAWLSQRPRRVGRQLSGGEGSALVIPLVIGLRTFGLIGLEAATPELLAGDAEGATEFVEETALRLETALLFDEVRDLATAEERRRVAREIHDGIAQELSYLGYFVDSLAADAHSREEPTEPKLRELRAEITRIINELRMSIFDLRSEVDVHGGLGAALSEYVRTVGRQSGLTVHLSLAESAQRLPAETEAELLRIAQEAVTNARKHAGADNLWVTLTVDPPHAHLRIEDDGRGLGRARSDSFGLQIMRERAKRLRTTVTVAPREPRGTAVEVTLGTPDRATLPTTGQSTRSEETAR
jgi:signal transduction histidine kinase